MKLKFSLSPVLYNEADARHYFLPGGEFSVVIGWGLLVGFGEAKRNFSPWSFEESIRVERAEEPFDVMKRCKLCLTNKKLVALVNLDL